MSVRQGVGLIITSHGSPLGHLAEADLVQVSPGLEPSVEPSMDLALHQAIYAAASEAGAVVHAHPRHAIALSLAGSVLVLPSLLVLWERWHRRRGDADRAKQTVSVV